MNVSEQLKAFALAMILSLGICFTGCDLTDSDDEEENEAPTITGLSAESTTVVQGVTYSLAGTVTDDMGIKTLTITLTDASGTETTVSLTSGYAGETSYDLSGQSVAVPVTADAGSATLSVTVTDDDDESVTETATLTVSEGTALLEGTEINVGSSQNATLGSSFDLETDASYLVGDAAQFIEDIDLVYLTVGNVDGLYSPDAAQSEMGWWSGLTPKTISFIKTDLDAADYDNLINKEQLEEIWEDGTKITTSVSCAEGDVFVLKTSDDNIAVILIHT